jgi:hypothetical protein
MANQQQVDALIEALLKSAAGPAAASNDAGSVTARGLREQIEAIKFVSSMAAVRSPRRGMVTNALRPSGAVFGHVELAQMDALSLTWMNRRFV